MAERENFHGRHVVVSGGTGALGAAVVHDLTSAGATCHIPCYDENEIATSGLADLERAHISVGIDLSSESSAVAYYDALPSCWASIHIAGGFAMAPIAETSAADVERMFKLNLMTCFVACREAIRVMRADAATPGGRIVNVAARPALEPVGGMTAYAVSKAAVASLTQSLAAEVASEEIYVNAVAPSIMDTPTNRADMPDADHGAWPKVEEVAHTIAFLAAPENRLTHGAVIPVYGQG